MHNQGKRANASAAPAGNSSPAAHTAHTRYAAFLSYSRAVDGRLAPALRHALQQFAKRWYRRRALRVFRDDDSLSANPGLWPSVTAAMDASEFFILLASPQAAASVWVAREADYWLSHKPNDHLLIAVTDGEIRWDPAAGDFDPGVTTCLPAVLYGQLADDPRWVDLRQARRAMHLSLRMPLFRDKVAELAAPLHHVAKDDLLGTDIRRHRNLRRLVAATIATLTVLTILASAATVIALNNAATARDNAARADRQHALALSRQLAAQSQAIESTQPVTARRLAAAAWRIAPTNEASVAMTTLLAQQRGILIGHTSFAVSVAFSPDGDRLASASTDGTVRLWDAATGQPPGVVAGHTGTAWSVAFSPDGDWLASASTDGTVRLWDAATGQPAGVLAGNTGRLYSVAFSLDGDRLASGGADRTVRLWDAATGEPAMVLTGHSDVVMSVVFSPDGDRLASAGNDGTVRLWDAATGEPAGVLTGYAGAVWSVAFSPDGDRLASAGDDRTVRLWDVPRPDQAFVELCSRFGSPAPAEWRRYAPGESLPMMCG